MRVKIYTDGGCIGNPGPGGYGVVIYDAKKRKELSEGFRLTTNNRMEILAAVVGLRSLSGKRKVTLYSDSRYVVDAMNKEWAARWRANKWKRNRKQKALNPDLWGELLDLCQVHDVEFVWVRGHAGDPGNERCDYLALKAAKARNLPPDVAYEKANQQNQKRLF